MARIQRLPPHVASRIAAGEVIERPASMLKELLENSLDAGASRVAIEVSGAGQKSLRISDDGAGMEPKDCELALERHATSKIGALEDLESLKTFGFRGEALYAISAVSRLTLSSCTRGAKTGWKIEAEAGKVGSSGPAPATPGTTLEVRDLFFNTPARRKFLKSDAFERGKLAAIVEEAALAHPDVQFTYKSEGRLTLRFDPASELSRVAAVLGGDAGAGLLPVVAERGGLRMRLYVSPADKLVSTRAFQYWSVNKRPIESRLLQQALYKAYGEHRNGKHPVCVGFLELNPDAFDVNVHPGKREIRFKNDGELFAIVSGLVASALAKSKAAAPIVRETEPVPVDLPAFSIGGAAFFVGERAQAQSLPLSGGAATAVEAPADAPRWYNPPYRFLGQIERSFLVFEASGGLFVLDQHAAAERILFEKYLGQLDKGVKVQRLMLPLSVDLPASAAQKVLSRKKRLSELGFEIAPFGKTGLHVKSVPALFEKAADLRELCHRLLDSVADPVSAARDVKHDAVATIACKAAVKAHDRLGEKEAMKLLEDLKDCADGSCCPHGRRAMLALGRDELARRFQRPGAVPL